MRIGFWLLLALTSCRTQPYDHPITDDFGVINKPVDMAGQSKLDMAAPNGGECASLVDCLNNCFDENCQNDCFNNASADAQNRFIDAIDCVYSFCLERDGTRPPRCVQDPDGNIDDPPDAGSGGCEECLTNAYAQLGGYECMPSNSPDCNPSVCQDAVLQCLEN